MQNVTVFHRSPPILPLLICGHRAAGDAYILAFSIHQRYSLGYESQLLQSSVQTIRSKHGMTAFDEASKL